MTDLALTTGDTKPNQTRTARTKLTPETVNEILTDKYQNGMNTTDIRTKYKISFAVLKDLDDKFGKPYTEKFGVKAKPSRDITLEDMEALWKAKSKK